jgi:ssDNA-binding replication factor A large subunit
MKISELFPRQSNVDVEGTIKEIAPARTFNKFGKELKVADSILEDESGAVKLTLWNDDIDNFKVGDQIRISKGYVNEYQGEKQLTSGKFGKIERIGARDKDSKKETPKDAQAEPEESFSEEEIDESEEFI